MCYHHVYAVCMVTHDMQPNDKHLRSLHFYYAEKKLCCLISLFHNIAMVKTRHTGQFGRSCVFVALNCEFACSLESSNLYPVLFLLPSKDVETSTMEFSM